MEIAGVKLDLHKVKVPVYNLATREDHIAPARSVLIGSTFFGGPVTFVLGRLRPHRRRHQSAGQAEIPVLDRRQADRHRSRQMVGESQGASRLLVAGLARLAQKPRCRNRAGARDGRRQIQAARGRARLLCQDARLVHLDARAARAVEQPLEVEAGEVIGGIFADMGGEGRHGAGIAGFQLGKGLEIALGRRVVILLRPSAARRRATPRSGRAAPGRRPGGRENPPPCRQGRR